jgi:hypothetical protein
MMVMVMMVRRRDGCKKRDKILVRSAALY